ncbi:MAG: sarcosine oxidase subunit gamma [Alphaproteobacteria bacterium]|jgi:sarcosine oxidase subunit gamma
MSETFQIEPLGIEPIGEQIRLSYWSGDPAPTLPGLKLPEKIGRTQKHGDTTALCLGPNEWILYTSKTEKTRLETITAITTLVDVSHRYTGLKLSGPDAVTALHMGCPVNLGTLSIGEGTRTIFDSVEIIVRRLGDHDYRVEFGRSFADYMRTRLEEARQEIEIDARRLQNAPLE